MRFINIEIMNFRNISSQKVDTDCEDIVLLGSNGMGKTNFLEAIYTLCYGSSFKTSALKETIQHKNPSFFLKADFVSDLGLKENISFFYDGVKRNIRLNDKEIKDRKELVSAFPCIIFSHEDLAFIRGEMSERRRFFDQTMSLYLPSFLTLMRNYKNILLKRNMAIKSQEYMLLSIYDRKLAALGFEIMSERKKAVDEFNTIFPSLFEKIAGKNDLYISYMPSWSSAESADDIVRILEEKRETDKLMLTTTTGVHRDRFVVKDSNGNFIQSGSTGQLRLCSLIFRLAEARIFTKKSSRKPLLLLDDVLLELDDEKRARFLDELDSYSQAFFTFLPRENYFSEDKKNVRYFNVSNGEYRIESVL